MAKGDTAHVILDGHADVVFTADRMGRRLAVNWQSKTVVVEVQTRGGTVVETGEFARDKVVGVFTRSGASPVVAQRTKKA